MTTRIVINQLAARFWTCHAVEACGCAQGVVLGCSADVAARGCLNFFGMEAEFWLNLQAHYDLALTREALAESLAAILPLAAAA